MNSRDGSFVVIFSGSIEKWEEMKILLGCSSSDNLFELLGGGFEVSDFKPDIAASREVFEETNGLEIPIEELVYFCHMVQKLPKLGDGEKGNVFCFYKEFKNVIEEIKPSPEHCNVGWHNLLTILTIGEQCYRTSTLRLIVYLLKYLSDEKFRFGILGDKVSFYEYEF